MCSQRFAKDFARLMKLICKTMYLRRTFSLRFFCTLFIIIITVSRRSYSHTLFSSRRLGIESDCGFDKVKKIQMFYFLALLRVQTILFILTEYRQNTGNVDLLVGSNCYFSQTLYCFQPSGSQVYSLFCYI